jgi:hypothetical protein
VDVDEVQSLLCWVYAKVFAISQGLKLSGSRLERFRNIATLESGLVVRAPLLVVGLAGEAGSPHDCGIGSFGPLQRQKTMRLAMPLATATILGTKAALGSFAVSLLELRAPGP